MTIFISMIICSSTVNTQNVAKADSVKWLNLVLKTHGGGVAPDVALYIASYLRDRGIDVSIIVEEWSVFIGTLFATHDFDLAVSSMYGVGESPDFYHAYAEDGFLNIYGLASDIPYQNASEQMLF